MEKQYLELTIRDLSSCSLEEIIHCFLRSFEDYFVKVPSDSSYWEARFNASGVNFNLSYGIFDRSELVAFIIHCVDELSCQKVAFNTGTGVLPVYRGQRLVDRLYAHAIPLLQKRGYTLARLEVIDKNVPAIRVYERIGFQIKRRLKCYQGQLSERARPDVQLFELSLDEVADAKKQTVPYSWDFTIRTIQRAGSQFKVYQVFNSDKISQGWFILDPKKGLLAQLDAEDDLWEGLFAGINLVCQTIKINNIDASRTGLIDWLAQEGVPNVIDQYEMEMLID